MSARFVSLILSTLLIIYGVNTIELFFRIMKAERMERKAAVANLEAKKQDTEDNDVSPVNESWFKRMLRTKGKKVLILLIIAHIIKFIIIAIGIILVAS